ncbi:MAG: hypothetical protein AAFU41_14470 [Pseudomonadota bacterium]
MTWADYVIVAAFPFFILGWGTEGWNSSTQTFIKNKMLFVLLNTTGFVLLMLGLTNQIYASVDGGLEVLSQIWTAFARVFGAGDA